MRTAFSRDHSASEANSLAGLSPGLSPLLHPALGLLLESYRLAQDVGSECRELCDDDFAVEVQRLRGVEATDDQIRWLLLKGLVKQVGLESALVVAETPKVSSVRNFCAFPDGMFADNVRLALTRTGLSLLQKISAILLEMGGGDLGLIVSPQVPASDLRHVSLLSRIPAVVPCWDRRLRALWVENHLVKQFRCRADNQELVLTAFEEEHWPRRIDDPLRPQPGVEAKLRLRDTISSLNRHHQVACLRFHGDGTGQGVVWELL